MRRAAATALPINSLIKVLVPFATTNRLKKVHPLQGGLIRLKRPSEGRPGIARESAWIFWPRFVWETIYKHAVIASTIGRLMLLKASIALDPDAKAYRDQALTAVADDEDVRFDLLTKTTGGLAAVAHVKKVSELTGASRIA